MGMSSLANMSPVSPNSPAGSSRGPGSASNFADDPIYISTGNIQVHRQNSDLGQSQALQHQRSLASSTESVGSTWKRFEISTKNDSLSSGFPFHPRLYDLKVTHDQWSLFSSDVVNAARLTSSKDALVWATGITTGTISSSFLLILGPLVGYYTGRLMYKKTVVKTVKERLGQEGDLRSVLRRWNEEVFDGKGFEAWLELPLDGGELHKENLVDEMIENPKAQKKAAKKAAKRFRIIIIPSGDPLTATADSASGAAPLTIPQLATDEEGTAEIATTAPEPPPYSPTRFLRSSPEYLSEKERHG